MQPLPRQACSQGPFKHHQVYWWQQWERHPLRPLSPFLHPPDSNVTLLLTESTASSLSTFSWPLPSSRIQTISLKYANESGPKVMGSRLKQEMS